eukprot:831092-Pyramimonas_sp.AAC.1
MAFSMSIACSPMSSRGPSLTETLGPRRLLERGRRALLPRVAGRGPRGSRREGCALCAAQDARAVAVA